MESKMLTQTEATDVFAGMLRKAVLVLLSVHMAFFCSAAAADVENPAAEVLLVDNGVPQAVIAVADTPVPAMQGASWISQNATDKYEYTQLSAAEELQSWLRKASGATLPIVPVSETQPDDTLILVGRSTLTEQFEIATPVEPEGVRIVAFARGVALVGEVAAPETTGYPYAYDRGVRHAVYFFLEEFLGFRFYFQHTVDDDEDFGIVIPRTTTLSVSNAIDFHTAPAFHYRTGATYGGAFLRGNALGMPPLYHPDGAWKWVYAKDHPEYFLMNEDGTRNTRYLDYSEPGVIAQRIKNLQRYYDVDGNWDRLWYPPTPTYITVTPQDNLPKNHAPRAVALSQPELNPAKNYRYLPANWGRQSNMYFTHIKQFAEEVAQRWPDKRVLTLAYQGYTIPPDFDLPDNVDVVLCALAPSHLYKEPAAKLRVDEMVHAWSRKLGGQRDRLYFWDYPCFPGFWTAAPTIYPHLYRQWLNDYRPYVAGELLNTHGRSAQESHWFMNLRFRLLWNPDLDVDSQLHDYCENFFGPAARPMEQFYRLMIDRYEHTEWSELAADYSAGLYYGLYGETYTPEVIEQLEGYYHEAVVAVTAVAQERSRHVTDGERWLQCNNSEHRREYTVELSGFDKSLHNPTITWNNGSLRYLGQLYRGVRLVVEPGANGPRAMLFPVELVKTDMSREDPRGGSTGGRQFAQWLRCYAHPGQNYRVSVTGRTEDGGNPSVILYYGPGEGTWGHEFFAGTNAFPPQQGNGWATVTSVFTVPPQQQMFNRIDGLRKGGTVWFSDVSIRPDIPETGIDVTDRIEGTLPILEPGEAVPMQIAGETENANAGADVTLSASVNEGSYTGAGDGYRRRVLWMRKWLEGFSPDRQAGDACRIGFFVEARHAHQWIDRVPEYTAARVTESPEPTSDDPEWMAAGSTFLRYGTDKITYSSGPFQRLGFTADVPTRVQVLHDEQNIYVAFRCAQSHTPQQVDAVGVGFFAHGQNKMFVEARINALGVLESEQDGLDASVSMEQGGWSAFFTIPVRLVADKGRELDAIRANFTRVRSVFSDKKDESVQGPQIEMPLPPGAVPAPAEDSVRYTWSPLIHGNLGWGGHPWRDRGIIHFGR